MTEKGPWANFLVKCNSTDGKATCPMLSSIFFNRILSGQNERKMQPQFQERLAHPLFMRYIFEEEAYSQMIVRTY